MHLLDSQTRSPAEERLHAYLLASVSARAHLTLLVNGYRSHLVLALEAMEVAHLDTAGLTRALAKSDQGLLRLGLPLLETTEDWMKVRRGEWD